MKARSQTSDRRPQFHVHQCNDENLLSVLSQVAGRKVLDKTGLSGHYDFTLSYALDRGDGSNRLPYSVFTALREQLGLDLKPQRAKWNSL